MRKAEIRPIRIPLRYPQEKGLVLYLPLDRIGEKKAFDLSPYKNHGTIYGAVWKPGKIGQALSFDGVDDYVEIPRSTSLEPSELTVEVWVKNTKTKNTNYDQLILSKYTYSYPTYGYSLTWGWGDDIYWRAGNGTSVLQLVTIALPRGDVWYHIVGTFKNGEQKLYVNGQLNGSNNLAFNIAYNSSNLYIGKAGTARLEGLIDEVRIYNRALSAAEVKEHYYRMNRVLAQITR